MKLISLYSSKSASTYPPPIITSNQLLEIFKTAVAKVPALTKPTYGTNGQTTYAYSIDGDSVKSIYHSLLAAFTAEYTEADTKDCDELLSKVKKLLDKA